MVELVDISLYFIGFLNQTQQRGTTLYHFSCKFGMDMMGKYISG